ncbi:MULTISPECIES: cytochrome c biogenesis CcdA family protein [Pseudomonas]|uniref:cytochrome c biogenesis CcdA family protein n=1 Tax=Pseudomonas TaxID=286 RepID=UPI000C078E8C|nr:MULTISPECIES: cytochrome c biogenesis CcdA family protein [Pseudomonas]NNA68243.1 cytochrome c biogenesis protein CcdA [Pseudomonas gessardii]PHN54510.1 cytochrome C biogenesis protein [Pseudomonas sp. ICMP 8385]
MSIELVSIPLAMVAGVLSILSPCVWPLVPVVMSSTAKSSKLDAVFLALGLSTSFAVAGTIISFVLLNLGIDPVIFRYVAAVLLVFLGLTLVVKPIGDWLTLQLSRLTSRVETHNYRGGSAMGQFGLGALLGLVWLPCVGPTLGAAIALASIGQDMSMAFVVMFAFGLGTAAVLILAAVLSGRLLTRWRPGLMSRATHGKRFLGVLLLVLGGLVLTGVDKVLETFALSILPDWLLTL